MGTGETESFKYRGYASDTIARSFFLLVGVGLHFCSHITWIKVTWLSISVSELSDLGYEADEIEVLHFKCSLIRQIVQFVYFILNN